MNDDRDAALQNLFVEAKQDLVEEEFTRRVMHRVDRSRWRAILAGTAIGLLFLACAWLLTEPVVIAVTFLTDLLPRSWIELDDGLVAQLFGPVNTVEALVAAVFLIVLALLRKIFR